MSIPAHMAGLLASLANVLLPEQLTSVTEGGRPGQPGGLKHYLSNHAAGYVQIEQPQAITSDGQQDVFWTPVAAVAPSEAVCRALADQVRLLLAGTTRDPGFYDLITSDQPRQIQAGVWLSRPTYATSLLDGQTPT